MDSHLSVPILVSSNWLRNRLGKDGVESVVLEVSWDCKTSFEQYTSAHIPGALFLPLGKGVEANSWIPRGFPNADTFTENLCVLGVNSNSHVILYDRTPTMAWAARAWLTFKMFGHNNVSLLNGGWHNWTLEGACTLPGKGVQFTELGNFTAKSPSGSHPLITSFPSMQQVCDTQGRQVIDCRFPEHFTGQTPEPSPITQKAYNDIELPLPEYLQAGHMPCAINLPEEKLLNPDTHCFLPPEQLTTVFQDAGVVLTKPITTTCYNGIKACTIVIATQLLGLKDVNMYAGSWTEWGQRACAKFCVTD